MLHHVRAEEGVFVGQVKHHHTVRLSYACVFDVKTQARQGQFFTSLHDDGG